MGHRRWGHKSYEALDRKTRDKHTKKKTTKKTLQKKKKEEEEVTKNKQIDKR